MSRLIEKNTIKMTIIIPMQVEKILIIFPQKMIYTDGNDPK